jgi:hypothetical protein
MVGGAPMFPNETIVGNAINSADHSIDKVLLPKERGARRRRFVTRGDSGRTAPRARARTPVRQG